MTTKIVSLPDNVESAAEVVQTLKEEISHAVVGQSKVVEQTLIALLAGGHVLIEGAPGLGKTLLVQAIAKTFNGQFSRIQFTPDLMPSDVSGHSLYDMQTGEFRIRKGPVFSNILLADEINRAPAKTQAALLEVMQEHQVTIDSKAYKLDEPFMTLATENPLEQEGTYPLPEAQLDRFLLKVLIDYPDELDEKLIVKKITTHQLSDILNVDNVNTIIDTEGVRALQKITASIQVDDRVIDYAVRIARKTRGWIGITVGAGPRGAIALIRAAKAVALINARDFVTPDDVKDIAIPALRHRIILTPEMEIEGQTADIIVEALIASIETPRS
ncbi:ATPase associated with various cellular activities, AAA_3 [hydrothermal vent metagenome]|uniref:ATPase associated with various cellular activities, AAA_3 n=1 Tax=hydrothermal vent metagenome TaxID=652676 RepID=A0A3B0YVW8_9ZZZZ